jgi:hypothetical protein
MRSNPQRSLSETLLLETRAPRLRPSYVIFLSRDSGVIWSEKN